MAEWFWGLQVVERDLLLIRLWKGKNRWDDRRGGSDYWSSVIEMMFDLDEVCGSLVEMKDGNVTPVRYENSMEPNFFPALLIRKTDMLNSR